MSVEHEDLRFPDRRFPLLARYFERQFHSVRRANPEPESTFVVDTCDVGEHLRGLFPGPAYLRPADWLWCECAAPHTDPSWRDVWFVTIAVHADHQFGDLEHPDEILVLPGTVFVVNPLVKHWLTPNDIYMPDLFLGVQWEVPHGAGFGKRLDLLLSRMDMLERRLDSVPGGGDRLEPASRKAPGVGPDPVAA